MCTAKSLSHPVCTVWCSRAASTTNHKQHKSKPRHIISYVQVTVDDHQQKDAENELDWFHAAMGVFAFLA